MFIGFDYGTSNCAVAVMEQGSPRLLNLGASRYLPSTLHAPHRDAIAGLLAEGLAPPSRRNTSSCVAPWSPAPRWFAARCAKRD